MNTFLFAKVLLCNRNHNNNIKNNANVRRNFILLSQFFFLVSIVPSYAMLGRFIFIFYWNPFEKRVTNSFAVERDNLQTKLRDHKAGEHQTFHLLTPTRLINSTIPATGRIYDLEDERLLTLCGELNQIHQLVKWLIYS